MVYAGIAGNASANRSKRGGVQGSGRASGRRRTCRRIPLNDDEIESYFLRLADSVPLPLVLTTFQRRRITRSRSIRSIGCAASEHRRDQGFSGDRRG
jgi:hypothetical protein